MRAATAQAAEVSGLKQKLERAEEELGLVKKQLEESHFPPMLFQGGA